MNSRMFMKFFSFLQTATKDMANTGATLVLLFPEKVLFEAA